MVRMQRGTVAASTNRFSLWAWVAMALVPVGLVLSLIVGFFGFDPDVGGFSLVRVLVGGSAVALVSLTAPTAAVILAVLAQGAGEPSGKAAEVVSVLLLVAALAVLPLAFIAVPVALVALSVCVVALAVGLGFARRYVTHRFEAVSTGATAAARMSDGGRERFWLILLAVIDTPALAIVAYMAAWQLARRLPDVPNWDSTFTWAPLTLVYLGPALLALGLLGVPAWVHPRAPGPLATARTLVLVGCQALVVFMFGPCPEWWRTGGFPPTWQIITLELLAAAVTLIPSVLLLWRRDDGTRRGWRAVAMVAPALVIVLLIAVASAVHGVPPYNPYAMAVVTAVAR